MGPPEIRGGGGGVSSSPVQLSKMLRQNTSQHCATIGEVTDLRGREWRAKNKPNKMNGKFTLHVVTYLSSWASVGIFLHGLGVRPSKTLMNKSPDGRGES